MPRQQRQRNKCTARNFSIASSALLDRQTLEEVLPVAGVLVGAPLLSRVTARQGKEGGRNRRDASQRGGCGAEWRQVGWSKIDEGVDDEGSESMTSHELGLC